jgi:hypothetical protein
LGENSPILVTLNPVNKAVDEKTKKGKMALRRSTIDITMRKRKWHFSSR